MPVTTSKAPNPKDSIANNKLPLHLWPSSATAMGCLALLDGAAKYGRMNWRAAPVRATVYIDALNRHTAAWMEGEALDPDSQIPHLSHALACLAILVDAGAAGTLIDDRHYPGKHRQLVETATSLVPRIRAAHADKNPQHFTIEDTPQPTRTSVGPCDEFCLCHPVSVGGLCGPDDIPGYAPMDKDKLP